MPIALLAVIVGALLVGCGESSGDGSQVPTSSAPMVREATINGAPWRLLVAGADGMRGRQDFGGADGMLFDLGEATDPSAVAFVMDGVSIPLAIAWFAPDGSLVGQADMVPCTAQPCARYEAPAAFRWAVEAPRGAFDALAPGASLQVQP
jgi:uncharacterized membrane protein (UPF0127 family)